MKLTRGFSLVLLTVLWASVDFAAAQIAFGPDPDPNFGDPDRWGVTELFSQGLYVVDDTALEPDGNDVLKGSTGFVGSGSDQFGWVVHLSNGENGNDGDDPENPDPPNTEPADPIWTTIGNPSGRLENGNVIRFSTWMRQDPTDPIVTAPAIESILKLEFWTEALSGNADFEINPEPTFGDRVYDTDQNGIMPFATYVDINGDGMRSDPNPPSVSLTLEGGWTLVSTEYTVDDSGWGYRPAGGDLISKTVADIEELRPVLFTGDFSATDLTDGGSLLIDNPMVEVYRTSGDVPGMIPNPTPAPPEVSLIVDRETGEMTLTNLTASTSELAGYAITSEAGGLDAENWLSIADNYDADSGSGFDPVNVWNVLNMTGEELSEASSTGDGGDLAPSATLSLGEAWLKTPFEDLTFSFTLGDGTTGGGAVRFTGNGGAAYERSDLNADGAIDEMDWEIFYPNSLVDLSGLGMAEAYLQGDLDDDRDNDFDDFRLFKGDFIAANGEAAWNALVPEPSSLALLALGVVGFSWWRRRSVRGPCQAICVALCCLVITSPAAFAGTTVFDLGSVNDTVCCGVYDRVVFTGQIEAGDPAPIRLDAPTAAGPTGDVGPFDLTDGATLSWSNIQGWNSGVNGEPDAATETYVHGSYFLIKDENPNPASYSIQTVSPSDSVEVFFLGGASRDAQVTFSSNDPVIVPSYAVGQDPPNDSWHSVGVSSGALSYSGIVELGNMSGSDPDMEGNVSAMRVVITSNFQPLSVEVDTTTGAVRLQNNSLEAPDIDYYEISSPGGALNTTGWDSLDDQDFDAANGGWNEAGGSNQNQLAELFLNAAGSPINTGFDRSIGNAFKPGFEGDLEFSYGVVGGGLVNGTVSYVSSPITCDFNGDDSCNIVDLNAMLAEGPIFPDGVAVDPGVNDQFDLNGDNVIDNTDRDLWLAGAATQNGLGSPYLIGDANLNGSVDVSDFNSWNGNKFSSTLKWDEGDFNSDGSADVSDFNFWNGNKFQSSDGVSAVPEPTGAVIALCALCGWWVSLRQRRL